MCKLWCSSKSRTDTNAINVPKKKRVKRQHVRRLKNGKAATLHGVTREELKYELLMIA